MVACMERWREMVIGGSPLGRHWAPSEIPKLDGGPLTYPSLPYPYLHEPFLQEIGAL